MRKRVRAFEKDLLLRCLKGEASETELHEAWEWINSEESRKVYFESLRESWIVNSINQPVDEGQLRRSWARIMGKTNIRTQVARSTPGRVIRDSFNISMPWTRLVAAVIAAFLLGGIAFMQYMKLQSQMNNKESWYTIEAPRGAKSRLTLTDGSTVYLNAGSRLRYPKSFNHNNRDVHLEGEGYFVVAKNKNLTFQVHTPDMIVKALGTEFNVKAYPDENRTETTLVKGSVSIIRQNQGSREIVLEPNQKLSLVHEGVTVKDIEKEIINQTTVAQSMQPAATRVRIENNVNPDLYVSWKEKRWVLERETLGSLVTKLERQYDVDFKYEDESIKDFHLSGTLEEESIEQVLTAMQLTLPINFKIHHKTVYLSINEKELPKYKQLIRNQ